MAAGCWRSTQRQEEADLVSVGTYLEGFSEGVSAIQVIQGESQQHGERNLLAIP